MGRRTHEMYHFSPLSPLSFLLQEVGEVIALVHVVHVFAFLSIQLIDSAPVAFLSQQELFQHTAIRVLVLIPQSVQLRHTDSKKYNYKTN